MTFTLTDDLRQEYQRLFSGCAIQAQHQAEVENTVKTICANKDRYQTVAAALGIPWYFVAVIHAMEASLNFQSHLHNGDPLTARTVQVPKGRPVDGTPPFTWEESAIDALRLRGLDKVTDWSLPGLLFELEGYNGFGYRRLNPAVSTPYLWSYSPSYKSGKFVGDGKFDPDAVSKQCGAAVILWEMVKQGIIQIDQGTQPLATTAS